MTSFPSIRTCRWTSGRIEALKDLAEIDRKKNGNGQSIDVDVDTDVLAVAKKLGISREDVDTINEGVKQG
ncbi:hypothetical protein [Inquilinus sp. CA228]|uniref:hypothetical protein n=1 Tax=Inquilinus sp. CA228 TaxID=3455609 RepID=UPI003F8D3D44